MDQETYSHYGWIVIVIIIIAILLGASYGLVHLVKADIEFGVGSLKEMQGGVLDNIGNANSFEDLEKDPDGHEKIEMISVEPGLYKTGSNYTELITPWSELVNNGTIHVEDGMVYTNCTGAGNATSNDSSDALAGDLFLPNDGSMLV